MDQRLRLRRIVRFVDFRKSEMTNYVEFSRKRTNRELIQSLGPNDCIMFTSTAEDQLVFVSGFRQIADPGATATTEREILCSRRLRLRNGRWSPQLLVNYGEMAGLKIDGPGLTDYRTQYEKRRQVPPRAERAAASKAESKPERPSAKQEPASAVLHHH
jgi:hypothetical protein